MDELFSIYQSYFTNKAFMAVLLLITLNNIWRKIEIKVPLQIIRYILIISGIISLLNFTYYLFFETDNEENYMNFLNRASGPMKFTYIFMIISGTILPFILLLKRIGSKKYIILSVAFLISIGFWFERFIIIVTSLYRGHMPASWAYYYPTWVELPIFLFYLLLISLPFILLIVNFIVYIRRKLKR